MERNGGEKGGRKEEIDENVVKEIYLTKSWHILRENMK